MELKDEKINATIQETDEPSGYARLEEYPSSSESTMTCSTLSSLVSLPTLESLSDSAPDLHQPDAKSKQCSVKRNRRGKRGRKPKQLPKTSPSDDNMLKEEGTMEIGDFKKRIKILLPVKVSTDMIKPNPNIAYSGNRFVNGVNDKISASPNLNTSESKKKRRNKCKYVNKKLNTSADISGNLTQEIDSEKIEFDDDHKITQINNDSANSLSEEVSIDYSLEAEIAFEKKVSELCKDIKRTNLGNTNTEGNTSKNISVDVKRISNINEILPSSAGNSFADLRGSAGPSTSHTNYVTDSESGPSMRDNIALGERKKKIFRKRRDTIEPKGFDATVKRKIMKLTDEIDQIDAILAKEIEKKDAYYRKGYKVTHQILTNLKKEKGHN